MSSSSDSSSGESHKENKNKISTKRHNIETRKLPQSTSRRIGGRHTHTEERGVDLQKQYSRGRSPNLKHSRQHRDVYRHVDRSPDSEYSISNDFEDEGYWERQYERSRERERERRKRQSKCLQRANNKKTDKSYVTFWDGFQWVCRDGENAQGYDQIMNATRKARRLHIANLPLEMGVQEAELKEYLWASLRQSNLYDANNPNTNPILNVWFARDRGGRFGFVEMATVEDAHRLLQINGVSWHGNALRVNRPSDYNTVMTEAFPMPGVKDPVVVEKLTAAAEQAMQTGNVAGLQTIVKSLVHTHPNMDVTTINKPPNVLLPTNQESQIQLKKFSHIVRLVQPVANPETQTKEELREALEDIQSGCSSGYVTVKASCIITQEDIHRFPFCSVGDVFLKFAKIEDADACVAEIRGRYYDGKVIHATIFDEYLFNSSNLAALMPE